MLPSIPFPVAPPPEDPILVESEGMARTRSDRHDVREELGVGVAVTREAYRRGAVPSPSPTWPLRSGPTPRRGRPVAGRASGIARPRRQRHPVERHARSEADLAGVRNGSRSTRSGCRVCPWRCCPRRERGHSLVDREGVVATGIHGDDALERDPRDSRTAPGGVRRWCPPRRAHRRCRLPRNARRRSSGGRGRGPRRSRDPPAETAPVIRYRPSRTVLVFVARNARTLSIIDRSTGQALAGGDARVGASGSLPSVV